MSDAQARADKESLSAEDRAVLDAVFPPRPKRLGKRELATFHRRKREEWTPQVGAALAPHLERRARHLEARGEQVGRERAYGPPVLGSDGEPLTFAGRLERAELAMRLGQEFGQPYALPEARQTKAERRKAAAARASCWTRSGRVARTETGRAQRQPPRDGSRKFFSQWHTSRAKGKRELFARVARCGTAAAHSIQIVCRNRDCAETFDVPIGCGSHHFCEACRVRTAHKFRTDFNSKRHGLVNAANRIGLTDRYRRRMQGGKFTEKLLTFTIPQTRWINDEEQAIPPAERVDLVLRTWPRFWRLFSDELRPTLQMPSGISMESEAEAEALPNGIPANLRHAPTVGPRRLAGVTRRGRPKLAPKLKQHAAPLSLTLWDLVSYLWVLEWTPGVTDGLGHPHIHVWIFSPYLGHERLQELWSQAYSDVSGQAQRPLVVDVRGAGDIEGGDFGAEIVKYLTKPWAVTDDGARMARPDVFAQVYTAIDGRRMRQSSAGLAQWKLGREVFCPCCGFKRERGHWGRVSITHALEGQAITKGDPPVIIYDDWPVIPDGQSKHREVNLRTAYDAEQAQKWREDPRRRMIATGTLPTSRATVAEVDGRLRLTAPRHSESVHLARALGVSVEWMLSAPEDRISYEDERENDAVQDEARGSEQGARRPADLAPAQTSLFVFGETQAARPTGGRSAETKAKK